MKCVNSISLYVVAIVSGVISGCFVGGCSSDAGESDGDGGSDAAEGLVDGALEGDGCVGNRCGVEPDVDPCAQVQCENNEECKNGKCVKIDPQECVGESCPDSGKHSCDGVVCDGDLQCAEDENGKAICLEKDCIVGGKAIVCEPGLKCVGGACTNDCEGGEFDPSTRKCIYKVESISLSTGNFNLLRDAQKEITAIVKPSQATNSSLSWNVKNITEGDSASGASLVGLENKAKSVVIKSKTAGAKKVLLTAHATDGSGVSASVEITIKPYCALNAKGELELCAADAENKRKYLECGFYGTSTTKVFNRDLFTEYVLPKMIQKDSKTYGTRASVVAAARFLILQFPYSLKYYDDPYSVSSNPTQSHYVWATGARMSSWSDAGIFGLNLTNNAYNSYDSSKAIKTDVVPWGCNIVKDNAPNGLACSGLVTWMLRNGRFFVGDWWTHIFRNAESKTECSDSSGNTTRYYMCEDYVNGKNPGWTNPNNIHDFAHEKLKRLDPATYPKGDFILVNENLTEETLGKVKAGDLLWHGKGDIIGESVGHIAIIIGMKRNKDGTLATMYVGESGKGKFGVTGNGVNVYSADFFKNCSIWAKTKCKMEADGQTCVKDSNGNCKVDKTQQNRGYDSFIIKMDDVYRYYSDVNHLSDDGNTYKYTDMWP